MKVIGLTRVRNESEIIGDTIEHLSTFCTGGIYIYDDDSTDNTVEICNKYASVKGIIRGKKWSHNREEAEFSNRQELLTYAQKHSGEDDWFIYIDADERVEFDWDSLINMKKYVVGIKMRLYDFYITDKDKNLPYTTREFLGPEYRDILILFKNSKKIKYHIPDQREVTLAKNSVVIKKGYIKHYGKAISIQQWEDTCEYYSNFFPKYSEKWESRKGKAIHSHSDFGNELIKWREKDREGIPLWKIEIKNKNIKKKIICYLIQYYISIKERIILLLHKINIGKYY